MTTLLPKGANAAYRGSAAAPWALLVLGLLTLGPGLIHSFLPDGGAGVIAGLDMGDRRDLVIGVFRWEGATQIAWGLAMIAVALLSRPLTPLFLLLVLVSEGLMALQAWVLAPPANGHHPPGHYGDVAAVVVAALFLVLALRERRA